MNFHLEQAGAGLRLRVDGLAGQGRTVLEKLRSCRQSAWACPSGECRKIGVMEEHPVEGGVAVTLIPRLGETFIPADIERCLRHALREFISA